MLDRCQFSKFHVRRRRVMGTKSVVFCWWLTLHTLNAFSIPARPLHRSRLMQRLSSTLPAEGQTAEVVVTHDDMYDLYTSVALLDPEWFQEYIVNMVGKQDEIVNDAFFQKVESIKTLPKESVQPLNRSSPMDYQFSIPFLELSETESNYEVAASSFNISNVPHPPAEMANDTEQVTPEFSTVGEIFEETAIILTDESFPLSSMELPVNVASVSEMGDPTELVDQPEIVGSNYVPTLSSSKKVADAVKSLTSEIVGSIDVATSSSADKVADSVKSSTESRVVVYWSDEEGWNPVNLTFVLQLGYVEPEIMALQSTALDCIVRDRIPKPRSGVPGRWKATESGMVQIVERSLVPDILRQKRSSSGPSKPDSKVKPPAYAPVDDALPTASDRVKSRDKRSVPPDILSPFDSIPTGVHSKGIEDAEQPSPRDRRRMETGAPSVEVKRPESKERRRRSPETPEKERPIYNGRPASAARRPENRPPPPKSGVWPDIDTFRKLLRDEASLRLRILGSDWSDVVKDEMDWRNDLYTSWLWTLHNGIGEPFVQSRSDRARRQTRDRR